MVMWGERGKEYVVEKGETKIRWGHRLVRFCIETHGIHVHLFSYFPVDERSTYTMTLMTLCQMEPHPEPGTLGLSDTLIFRLASVSPSTVHRDTATKKYRIFSLNATTWIVFESVCFIPLKLKNQVISSLKLSNFPYYRKKEIAASINFSRLSLS